MGAGRRSLGRSPRAGSRPGGFTLVELLVVISIIVMLLMVFIPNIRSIQHRFRITQCQTNLHDIGVAIHGWQSEDKLTRTYANLLDRGWPVPLGQYLNNTEPLVCPEGGDNKFTAKYGTAVEELVQIVYGDRGVRFEPGPRVIKLSGTQWKGISETTRLNPPTYAEDGAPNVYWWGYEDGGDFDYQDIAMRVTVQPDGTAELWCQSWTAGKPEIGDMQFRVLARHEELNAYYFGPNTHKVLHLSDVYLPNSGSSSYALNYEKTLRTGMMGKLLGLDYVSIHARGTDNWEKDSWDADGNGQPDFLRHMGQLNVLFMDNSARRMPREQVDPVDLDVEKTYWLP